MTETSYQFRVTIAPPDPLIYDANQLALCLGESAADDRTFKAVNYEKDGNLFSLSSTVAKLVFVQMAGQPLVAPDHAPDVDLEAATRAQAALVIQDRTQGDPPVTAGPDRIAVIIDHRLASAQEHIQALGLTAVPSEDDAP